MVSLDFPFETLDFAAKDGEPDEVRAVWHLLSLYARSYLKRSASHRILFTELARRTMAWLRAGGDATAPLYLAREDLRRALRAGDAEVSEAAIDGTLQTMALNLSTLGAPTRNGASRGRYDHIDERLCTMTVQGEKRVMYLAGPSPADRGEREKQDALFLEPRVADIEVGPRDVPPILRFDPQPFERVDVRCQFAMEGLEARERLRSIFAAVPLTLHGPKAILRLAESFHHDDGSFDEEWVAYEHPERAADGDTRAFAEATIIGDAERATLEGSMLLYPELQLIDVLPMFTTVPPAIIERFGFAFALRLPAPTVRSHDEQLKAMEAYDAELFNAVIGALRSRGVVIRRDPYIGDVIALSPFAELGIFVSWLELLVTFQRVGERPLLAEISEYPLASLLSDIFGPATTSG